MPRQTMLSLARLSDPDLAGWIAANASLPNSMVDYIVPATRPAELELARGCGIAEFYTLRDGRDALAYEARMDEVLDTVSAIPVPTIAAIDALAVGRGFNIAAACDIRIATKGARFGAPIARTLGNCLSMRNYSVLLSSFGPSLAWRMLLLGELICETELAGSGFLARVVETDEPGVTVRALAVRIAESAPLTLAITRSRRHPGRRSAFPRYGRNRY